MSGLVSEAEYQQKLWASVELPPLPIAEMDDTEIEHMRQYAVAAALIERKACWDAINKWIVPGPLKGNGCDDHAQRNGMILATNQIAQRGLP